MSRAGLASVAICIVLFGPSGVLAETFPGFESVRDRLRVQIRNLTDPPAPGSIWREDLFETRTILVRVDADGRARDVSAVEAAGWGKTPDELFALGLANLEHRQPPLLKQTPSLERGVKIQLLYGEHEFAAAYALSVAHYPTCMGKHGALVAVPSRHATLCHPIDSSRAFHAYLALIGVATQIIAEGKGPIVPHVYWFHDGVFDAQRVRLVDGRLAPERTEAFRDLLKSLPRDIHDTRRRRW